MIEIKEKVEDLIAKDEGSNKYGNQVNILQNFELLDKKEIEVEVLGEKMTGYILLLIDKDLENKNYYVGVAKNGNIYNKRTFRTLDKAKKNFEKQVKTPITKIRNKKLNQ